MILTLQDRYTILNLLPPAGDLLYIRTVKQLVEMLPATEEEMDQFHVHGTAENGLAWDKNPETGVEMEFSRRQRTCIEEQLKKKESELTLALLSVWDAFFPEDEEDELRTRRSS